MKWIQEKYTIIKTWMNLSFLSFEIEVHFLTLLHLLFNSSLFPDARFGLLSDCVSLAWSPLLLTIVICSFIERRRLDREVKKETWYKEDEGLRDKECISFLTFSYHFFPDHQFSPSSPLTSLCFLCSKNNQGKDYLPDLNQEKASCSSSFFFPEARLRLWIKVVKLIRKSLDVI